MTLRYPQRLHRRRKKDAKKNFRWVDKGDGKRGVRGTKKPLCVRVSQQAYDRLTDESIRQGLTKEFLLSKILYAYNTGQGARERGVSGYHWDHVTKEPEGFKAKRSHKGAVQLNLRITYTAWMKLQALKVKLGKSKAWLVNDFILAYKPCSEEYLAKMKQDRAEAKARAEELYGPTRFGTVKPTVDSYVGSDEWYRECSTEEYEAWLDNGPRADQKRFNQRWENRNGNLSINKEGEQ